MPGRPSVSPGRAGAAAAAALAWCDDVALATPVAMRHWAAQTECIVLYCARAPHGGSGAAGEGSAAAAGALLGRPGERGWGDLYLTGHSRTPATAR